MTETVIERAHPARHAPVQVVLLPPAYSGPRDFVSAGFVAALQRRSLDVDLTLGALEFGHVTDHSVVTRVLADLVTPLRGRGAVWLGGISLGGYVALCCAAAGSAGLAGLCLFAPYLGSHIVTSEIARDGLQDWAPREITADDDERRLWRFLQARAGGVPPIHLGLGREDRFLPRHQLLAASLQPQEVDTVPGGHDWPTWLRLWENFLDARLAPRT